MRLSLDCGCVAVATQGGSDNPFTIESLAAVGTAAEFARGTVRCLFRTWLCFRVHHGKNISEPEMFVIQERSEMY
jgi:hypothetical protein